MHAYRMWMKAFGWNRRESEKKKCQNEIVEYANNCILANISMNEVKWDEQKKRR